MSKHGELPVRLCRLEQRFVAWRKTRSQGKRIPEVLWKSAAAVAEDCGLNLTAKVLKLDYYSLKKRVDQLPGKLESRASHKANVSFIELPSSSTVYASECVIEFEDTAGASLRVHLKSNNVLDVLALGRNFWTGQ